MERASKSACAALEALGYDLTPFGSVDELASAIENADLEEPSSMPKPVLLAAIAVAVYAEDLLDYVSPAEPYLAAATAVEIDGSDAEWGAFVRKHRLFDSVAEILEIMIVDLQGADAK